ncbi:MAG: hypothetical protein KW804_01335 [Candidatus Doudnabacteria bacterium]|nr:hypothetical protein [Candidatus Doudnabacteria bacterium]
MAAITALVVSCSLAFASPAVITNFKASSTEITAGQSVTLSWSTKNSLRSWISPLGTVEANGTVSVKPERTTTYQLVTVNRDGYKSARVTVRVKQKIEINLTADKYTIRQGEEVANISWSTNADSIEFKPLTVTEPSGTVVVSPWETTTYQLIARKAGGWRSKKITIRVIPSSNLEAPTPANPEVLD